MYLYDLRQLEHPTLVLQGAHSNSAVNCVKFQNAIKEVTFPYPYYLIKSDLLLRGNAYILILYCICLQRPVNANTAAAQREVERSFISKSLDLHDGAGPVIMPDPGTVTHYTRTLRDTRHC